jgi:arabinose-5-phosphate isomerase
MSTEAIRSDAVRSEAEQLSSGRAILRQEGETLLRLAEQLDWSFCRAVDYLYRCGGSVIVSGMGKAGLVGQKIAATLASTGTRSHFLHPAEAIHGDLGRIHRDDVVLVLSHSGETEEVVRLLPSLQALPVPILAVTGRPHSSLAQQATVTLWIGAIAEAGRLQLAPSTSTTAMLALGDALALVTSQRRGFSREDFARFHPGGSLGRQLSRVEDLMRPASQCRVAADTQTVRHVLVSLGRPGRRCGAVLLTDPNQCLSGIFTDSDLARILERQQDAALDRPIREVMTNSPTYVAEGTMISAAIELLVQHKISELPVVNHDRHPIGLIDITDIVGLLPHDGMPADTAVAAASQSGRCDLACSSPIILSLPNRSAGSS